jgi:ribosomal protein S18 acetylase RimI-like enzyme
MISIQKVDVTAVHVIKELVHHIWPLTYHDILSAEQMDYMLDLFYSETSLQKQFQQGHQFILALNESEPVGFASYSPKDEKNNTFYRLHKIYINPNQQGKGIGKIIIDFIINEIKIKNATGLELNVNRHNKALHFYQKNGFEIIKEEDINIGNGYFMNDYVMLKKIYSTP